jgi:hypothetical protein
VSANYSLPDSAWVQSDQRPESADPKNRVASIATARRFLVRSDWDRRTEEPGAHGYHVGRLSVGQVVRVKPEHVGKRGKCPGCGQLIEIRGLPAQSSGDHSTSVDRELRATGVERPADIGTESEVESKPVGNDVTQLEGNHIPAMSQVLCLVSIVVSSIALVFSILTAASTSRATVAPALIHPLQQPDSRLAGAVDQLQTDIKGFQDRVSHVEFMQSLQRSCPAAALDLASKRFERVDSSIGFFLVSCQNAQPFLDGYKVTLHVGNPQSASYTGFTVGVEWGPKYKGAQNDTSARERWRKSLKSQEFSLTDRLHPGRWNEVEITLQDTTADRMGELYVSINANVASLGLPVKAPSQ